jgi:hypothetical protein
MRSKGVAGRRGELVLLLLILSLRLVIGRVVTFAFVIKRRYYIADQDIGIMMIIISCGGSCDDMLQRSPY